MDIHDLYLMAKKHSVRALICDELEKVGINDRDFINAKLNAIRKCALFDLERGIILNKLENRHIWYMPLKGIILMNYYPKSYLREMADNDILFDAERRADVKELFENSGYNTISYRIRYRDVYNKGKEPVLSFEMHTGLYGHAHGSRFYGFYDYYSDVKSRLIKDENNVFGYHFSDEDFYIYMTSHEYKHFTLGGTGIRSLLDCYVYLKEKGNDIDFGYIVKQCESLGIAGFEAERRALALKVFTGGYIEDLSEDEYRLLNKYIKAGTYGTINGFVKNRLDEQYKSSGRRSKLAYICKRIFIPLDLMSESVPFVNNNPLLYPFGVIVRLCRAIREKREAIRHECNALKEYKNK